MLKKILRNHQAVVLGLLFTALTCWWQLHNDPREPSFLNRLDYILYDWRLNSTGFANKHPDHNILIVDIDERSLKVEGQWPWARTKVAKLVQKLSEQGAIVVSFDVLFSEPEQHPLEFISNLAEAEPELLAQLEQFRQQSDGDQLLAQAFQQMDVVLSYLLREEPNTVGALGPIVEEMTAELSSRSILLKANGYTGNIPLLADSAISSGFFNPTPDPDGVIRSVPLVWRIGDKVYPSLALATAMTYLFQDEIHIKRVAVGDLDFVEGIQFTKKLIKTDSQARVIVPYIGPRDSYTYVSATDVLNDQVDLSIMENAVVMVGTTAVGLFDLRTTPVGTEYPGVEVHANVVNALMSGDFPYAPDWSDAAVFVFLLLIGIIFSFVLPKFGPVVLFLFSVFVLVILIITNFWLWQEHKLALPLASSLILLFTLSVINLVEGFWRSTQSRREVTEMFGQYVPRAHIDHMLEAPDDYGFDGESKELTVLFSDIRSFTTISEKLSAIELKSLLNRYFTPITEIIFNNRGTIDKYVGDMVMAFWGAPLDDENHAENALKATMEMLEKIEALKPEFVADGLPEVNVGIGLNTGPMNVGDMGSNFRRAYTVLGDAVNLGSRLESLTKFYGVQCLVGPDTKDLCPNYAFRFVDKIIVKGKDEPIQAWEPLCLEKDLSEDWQTELKQFEQAYENYANQNWQDAIEQLTQLTTTSPRPFLYQVYLDRIESLKAQDLPEDWDGTFRHTSK